MTGWRVFARHPEFIEGSGGDAKFPPETYSVNITPMLILHYIKNGKQYDIL